MATSTTWAQELIICYRCSKPALRFCNNCQVNICLECVSSHLEKHHSLSHDIVPFRNRKLQLVFSECNSHQGQRCEAYCQNCETPICTKCFIGMHKGHDAEELSTTVKRKKEEIHNETEEIENKLIPEYKAVEADLKAKIRDATEIYTKQEQETENLRNSWHKELDDIFDQAVSMNHSKKEHHLGGLEAKMTKLQNMIPDMIRTVQQNKEKQQTNKASDCIDHVSKLTDYRNISTSMGVLQVPHISACRPNAEQESKRCEEIERLRTILKQVLPSLLSTDVSNISSKELLDQAILIATIPTYYNPLWRLICVGSNEAFITGNHETISCINMGGSTKSRITTSDANWPSDISLTGQGELVYSDSINRTLNIIRQGKSQTLFSIPQGWRPGGLCCTSTGDILVNIQNNDRNKIVRYHERNVTQEIDVDEHGDAIFQEGRYSLIFTENNNGDICVSDKNADTLVAVDKTGRVRFRYDGTQAGRKKSFGPGCIITDSESHIIVADPLNDCLHILNRDGNFLRCLHNCGIKMPLALGLDREGRLWVGLTYAGEIKVIKYHN